MIVQQTGLPVMLTVLHWKVFPFNKMLDRNGRENWFAIDNYIDEELMKNYYYDKGSLNEAYDNCDSFISYQHGFYYSVGDFERLKRGK